MFDNKARALIYKLASVFVMDGAPTFIKITLRKMTFGLTHSNIFKVKCVFAMDSECTDIIAK
jgi:hypothetical protein